MYVPGMSFLSFAADCCAASATLCLPVSLNVVADWETSMGAPESINTEFELVFILLPERVVALGSSRVPLPEFTCCRGDGNGRRRNRLCFLSDRNCWSEASNRFI